MNKTRQKTKNVSINLGGSQATNQEVASSSLAGRTT